MRIFGIILGLCILIAIDFSLKFFFHGPFQNMFLNGDLYGYFPIFGEYFGIKLIYNTGIAFGLPVSGVFLQIMTLAIIAGLCYYYSVYEFSKKSYLLDVAFVCILSGALAHAYERIFEGRVVDFLLLKYFAIFNFADILITIGGILFLVFTLFYERK